jgi:hypothetical protein
MECPLKEKHTPCPEGYLQWHDWARTMSYTNKQKKCEGCGLFQIWLPKVKTGPRKKKKLSV